MARVTIPQPPPAKNVLMYRNGDRFFVGKKFVICQRQVSTFDTFLTQVTRSIEAPFGAVRNIYTPRWGHRIKDLDGLQNGEKYVAAGAERFKKFDYLSITTQKPQRRKFVEVRPVVHSRIIVPARWQKFVHEPYTINVFTNGDLRRPPIKILIPKYIVQDWERILAVVTEKIHLRTGAVQRLCTVDGQSLTGIADLESNQYYVAVGSEKFKRLPYLHWLSSKTPREAQGLHSKLLPPMRRGRRTKENLEESRTQSTVEGPSRDHADMATKEGSSYFHTKPGKVKQHKKALSKSPPPLSDSEEGHVFKAHDIRREVRGATEVHEDKHLKVDLPIDQVPAEIVSEEEMPPLPHKSSPHSPRWWRRLHGERESKDHEDAQGQSKAEEVHHSAVRRKGGTPKKVDFSTDNYSKTPNSETESKAISPSSLKSAVSEGGRKSEELHNMETENERGKGSKKQGKYRNLFGFQFRMSAKTKDSDN